MIHLTRHVSTANTNGLMPSKETVAIYSDNYKKRDTCKCDNLIPRMAKVCCLGVESGKHMYTNTFRHIPACVYMHYRPNESFIPCLCGILSAEK
jgi:hypothetical protein